MQHNYVGTNGGLGIHGLLDLYQRISTIGHEGYDTQPPPPVTSAPRAEGTHDSKRQPTESSGQYNKLKHQTKIGTVGPTCPFASSKATPLPSRHLRLPCSKCLLHRDSAGAVLPSRAQKLGQCNRRRISVNFPYLKGLIFRGTDFRRIRRYDVTIKTISIEFYVTWHRICSDLGRPFLCFYTFKDRFTFLSVQDDMTKTVSIGFNII